MECKQALNLHFLLLRLLLHDAFQGVKMMKESEEIELKEKLNEKFRKQCQRLAKSR